MASLCCNNSSACANWAAARVEFQELLASRHLVERRGGNGARHRAGHHACECQPVLEVEMGGLDGFALECHFLGRAMRMAMATGRTMLVGPGWRSAYAPPDLCAAANGTGVDGAAWGCVWSLGNTCPYGDRPGDATRAKCARRWHAARPYSGIVKKASAHFNTAYYGPAKSQRVYFGSFPFGDLHINGYDPRLAMQNSGGAIGTKSMPPFDDPVPAWERRYGAFWVRALCECDVADPPPLRYRLVSKCNVTAPSPHALPPIRPSPPVT